VVPICSYNRSIQYYRLCNIYIYIYINVNACAVLNNMCIRANLSLSPKSEEAIMAMKDDLNNEEMQSIPEGRAIFNEGQ